MYDTIAVFETQLQKKIIFNFIEIGLIKKKKLLIIDASNHKLKLNELNIDLNFNKISNIFKSFKNIKALKKLNLKCKTLISTQFTGINALFFSSFINSDKKILIDDGIGTPVLLLDNSLYNRLFRFQLRFYFIKSILRLFFNIKLLSVQKATITFDSYYSIYNLGVFFDYKPYEFRYIDGIIQKYDLINKEIGFIGAPMVEFGLTSEKKLKALLSKIVKNEGPFSYFLHPDEKYSLDYNIQGVNFLKPNMLIERYFEIHGVPKTLYSFSSSAALNIATANPQVNVYNIGYESYFRNKNQVYLKVLNQFSVKKSFYNL
tara:strand:- start:2511 stop:3461 length:951 start_codon:yes stop_codon:yes gene_type:complete